MARRKKQEEISEAPEVEKTTEAEISLPKKQSGIIEDEQDAIDFVIGNYQVPDYVKVVYVSQDQQVFYQNNPAVLHGRQNNIKIFAIKWG